VQDVVFWDSCKFYSHGQVDFGCIKEVWWKMLIYGKCMVYHEDIGETCAIVGGPTIFIITKIHK
jgi:hypothetical protein